jgi:tetratricopeptide (TPR) repeat protein
MIQARKGLLDEALAHYQQSVELVRQAAALQPTSVNNKRDLVIAYSHVGDLLGNPLLPNLGRPEQAVKPYEEMVSLARSLRESDLLDARSATDLAFAQYRLASVLPTARSAERQALLDSAGSLLRQLLAKAPDNQSLLRNLAIVESFFGDHFRDVHQPVPAIRHYREALAIIGKNKSVPTATIFALEFRSRTALASLLAASGEGTPALAELDRLAAPSENFAGKLAATPLGGEDLIAGRSLPPRLQEFYAAVHEALGNKEKAAEYRKKAETGWRELEKLPGFDDRFRREVERFRMARPASSDQRGH